ncbi:glycosyltransferase [Candidatus Pelagibacter sp.]|nr:glycosyltransferase [Candidatus Pelagibacter sp.]
MEKKILIWAPFVKKVGTTTNVLNSIQALKKFSKKKYKIFLINVFGEWDKYIQENEDIQKINLFKSNFILEGNADGFIKSRFYMILIFLKSLIPLTLLIRRNKYDYIFCHLITSLPIFITLFTNKKIKTILNIAGYPKLNFLRKNFWKLFGNNIYKIICPSNETKKLIKMNGIFGEDKLIKIDDPHINIKIFNKKKLKVDHETKLPKEYIVCVGRLTKQKNFLFLINSFDEILAIRPNIKLVIIGEGEERQKLELAIKKKKLSDNIFLYGYKENIYEYLKNAKCYLSVSLWEGPDLAMLDAAYFNLPIICSNCPSGRKEFINDGEAGYIFEINNKSSLISEMNKFFTEDFHTLSKKLVSAKRKVKNFTLFNYYSNIKKLII